MINRIMHDQSGSDVDLRQENAGLRAASCLHDAIPSRPAALPRPLGYKVSLVSFFTSPPSPGATPNEHFPIQRATPPSSDRLDFRAFLTNSNHSQVSTVTINKMPSRAHMNKMAAKAKKAQDAAANGYGPSASNTTTSTAVAANVPATANAAPVADGPVEEKELVDLHELGPIDRKSLTQGPRIKILQGDTIIAEVPRLLFVSTSTLASSLLTNNQVVVPDKHHKTAIGIVVEWLAEATRKNVIKKPHGTNDVLKDLYTIYAAEALGLGHYWAHLKGYYKKYLSGKHQEAESWPSAQETKLINQLADDSDDVFLVTVANRLLYIIRMHRKGEFPGFPVNEFNNNIANYPKVYEKMQEIDAPWREKRRLDREDRDLRQKEYKAREAARQRKALEEKDDQVYMKETEEMKALRKAKQEANRLAREKEAQEAYFKRHTYKLGDHDNEFPDL